MILVVTKQQINVTTAINGIAAVSYTHLDVYKRQPLGSPTLSDQALMSFPSVKIGPGRSSRSHTAEDYIMLKEIEEAIGLYLELLDGLLI